MTKRTRTILFLLLGAIFFLLTPALIFYSQGWGFDWEQKRFSQTGAFYFNVTPPHAEIFVNDRSIGKTVYVLGTTLTKNFPPDIYHVQVQKEGYHSWEKYLEIFPKQVTEAKHIILLPANPTFIAVSDHVLSVWPAPDKTEAIVQKANSKNTWTLFLWDVQKNTEHALYESSRLQDEVWNIQWNPRSDSFLLRIASQEQLKSFIQRIDRGLLQRQRTAVESLRAAAQLRTPIVSQLEYVQAQTEIILPQNALTFFTDTKQILWLDQKGVLWRQTNKDAPALQINQKPIPPQAETPYTIFVFGNEFFIQEKEMLYVFNPQTQAFEKLLTPFSEMTLSPDGKKLTLSGGKEIWLYFLQEEQEQPPRQKGDKVFLTRFSEEIKNLAWFDAHHIMFVRGETIVVSEIDNRDHLNMMELATFSNPSFFWQDGMKTLFVHTGRQLRASEKLLP